MLPCPRCVSPGTAWCQILVRGSSLSPPRAHSSTSQEGAKAVGPREASQFLRGGEESSSRHGRTDHWTAESSRPLWNVRKVLFKNMDPYLVYLDGTTILAPQKTWIHFFTMGSWCKTKFRSIAAAINM
uniref:Uncharacterized protein n=1 Tax=Sphaerodactylus townsendi TaxID=933632 RepID=A0ACB8FTK5_9SAUR